MKRSLALLAPLLVGGMVLTVAEARRGRTRPEVMREKLVASQKLLEGLALEDFGLLARQAVRLGDLTQVPEWRAPAAPDAPGYDQQSLLFRRQAEALHRAARDRDLDACTLAYVRLTMGCVDCHRLLRGQLPSPGARGPTDIQP